MEKTQALVGSFRKDTASLPGGKSLHGLLDIQKNFITLTQYLDLIRSFSKSQIEGREEARKC